MCEGRIEEIVCAREREKKRFFFGFFFGRVMLSLLQAHGFAPCIDNELILLTVEGILMASARTENLRALEICLLPDDGFVFIAPNLERLIEILCESIV
jgi:hypothetical protein